MLVSTLTLAAMAVSHGSVSVLVVELTALGVGLGLFIPANNTAIVTAAPRCDAGVVSGLLNMCRGLGTAVGLAIASLVLGAAAPSPTSPQGAVARGFTTAMAILAAISLIAVVLARQSQRAGVVPCSSPATPLGIVTR